MPTRKILQSRDNDSAIYATQGWASHFYALFKLRLGALIPRSVCLFVLKNLQKKLRDVQQHAKETSFCK